VLEFLPGVCRFFLHKGGKNRFLGKKWGLSKNCFFPFGRGGGAFSGGKLLENVLNAEKKPFFIFYYGLTNLGKPEKFFQETNFKSCGGKKNFFFWG